MLYVLAKAGEPIRKRTISHATPRWNAKNRNMVLEQLEREGLIKCQLTPARQRQAAGYFYWLTPEGIETTENLEAAGEIQTLPANWRESHV